MRKIHRVVRVNPVEGKPRRRTHRVVRVNPHIAADSPMMAFQQYVARDLNKFGAITPSTRFRETKIGGRTALSVTGVDPYRILKDRELLARLTRLAHNSGLELTPGAGAILFSQPFARGREAHPNPTFPKGNFDRCVADVSARGDVASPQAVCAKVMRKKYGSSFQKAAIRGRRAAMRNPRSKTSEPKHREPADAIAARELVLYATNDSTIYRHAQEIIKNLARKQIKGTYDPKLAVKLWLYWADGAAKKYEKEFGGFRGQFRGGPAMFSPATRYEAARMAVDEYAEELAMTRAEMSKGKAKSNPPLTPQKRRLVAQKRRINAFRKRGPSGRL